tara:strand:- start:96 stop:446 length:351 start_codon:yes stop_codon:yes gene_type:complete
VLLNVSVVESDTWTILRVVGEIDMATGPDLRQHIVGQIQQGNTKLVIDLASVEFIDSTGLGVLIGGLKRARSQGGDLRVSGVQGRIERLFELTGLGNVFSIVDAEGKEGGPELATS